MEISQQLGLPDFQKNEQPSFEMNYYGAAKLVATQLGLPRLPPLSHLSWIHGWRPEKIVYPDQLARDHHIGVRGKEELQFTIPAAKRTPFLVATKEHEALLQKHGYSDTKAVGLPFVYVDPDPGVKRMARSLLVMPSHVLIGMDARSDEIEYLEYIKSIAGRFSRVVFCVNLSCVVNKLWIDNIEKYGFEYVLGAGLMDLNALIRMRRIFDSFEYMTSNGIGSHVVYAGLCGVKVSLAGPLDRVYPELFKHEPEWKDPVRRERIAFANAQVQHDVLRARFPWLYVHPWEAKECVEWSRQETGYYNRVSCNALAQLFGWPVEQLLQEESLLDTILRLEAADDMAKLLQYLQQPGHTTDDLLGATIHLLAKNRLRSAFIVSVLLKNHQVQHVAVAFALALGGLLTNHPEESSHGRNVLPTLLAALAEESVAIFRTRIAIPLLSHWLDSATRHPNRPLVQQLVSLALVVDQRLAPQVTQCNAEQVIEQAQKIRQVWQAG
ncbi:MAG: hypothetical protein HQM04_11660 [Magnetococcales bacterium]|nr:hypothetical protein [Magnetococcales bacterium]MBF0115681.1 hypothetical protein [Magnetococcales bacterium]